MKKTHPEIHFIGARDQMRATETPPAPEVPYQFSIMDNTVCVFFQGASDGNVKISRNIAQKLKDNEKLDFYKKNRKSVTMCPGCSFS